MAVKDKSTLEAEIDALLVNNSSGLIEADEVNSLLQDLLDSYEDFIGSYTTAQRDLISTPTERTIIYNTDNHRYEFHDGVSWKGLTPVRSFEIDCSGNPNYPASQKGDQYIVSVIGKIGGGSGVNVAVGDIITCRSSNAGGTHASVGSDFYVTRGGASYTGDVLMPPLTIYSVDGENVYTVPEIDGATVNSVFRGGAKVASDLYSVLADEITFVEDNFTDDEEITIFYTKNSAALNLGGVQAIKKTTTAFNTNPFVNYSAAQSVVATPVIDLTTTGTYNYNFGADQLVFIDRIKIVVSDSDTVSGNATFELGTSGDANKFATINTAMPAEGGSDDVLISDADGVTDFQVDVTSAATATSLKVRILIYCVGVQNETGLD